MSSLSAEESLSLARGLLCDHSMTLVLTVRCQPRDRGRREAKEEMKVLLLHLDLGIGPPLPLPIPYHLLPSLHSPFPGGAERLMVNLSLAMQDLGHDVKIFTSHHDPQRCFQETTRGG